jgi:hypothetical protein
MMNDNDFLSFSILSTSLVLSLYRCLDTQKNDNDFFPTTSDKSIFNKLLWYTSHLTFSSNFILTYYYFLRLFKIQNDYLFIVISPISLSVNLNYFLILYPKKNLKLYEISYYSFIQHFMDTFIILNTVKYIEYKSIYEIFYYNYYILFAVSVTLYNYYKRNIWTYNIANLFSYKGWFLFLQFSTCSLVSSFGLYNLSLIL